MAVEARADPGRLRRSRRGGRRALSHDRIVATAMAIARSEGIEALSMRRLADDLDTAPMSLYRHVADRQALLLAMLDEIARGLEVPPPADDPRAEITAIMTAAHDLFRRDPWVVHLLVVERLASPLIFPVVERMVAALRRGGVADEDLLRAYALLWHYTYGEALSSHHDRPDAFSRRLTDEMSSSSQYPTLALLARQTPPPTWDFYAGSLPWLLDALLPRGGESPTG
jgi:AcrR family transcriptional regulator